jgi:uncharacterized protein (DUF2384 family)
MAEIGVPPGDVDLPQKMTKICQLLYDGAVRQLPIDAYRRLNRFFPTLSARSRALGLSRETLTRWERDPSSVRVRDATATSIESLVRVAEDAEDLIGDPRSAGDWLLAAQPALGGATAASVALDGSERARATVERIMLPAQDPPPEPTPRGVIPRVARRGSPPPGSRTRPRRSRRGSSPAQRRR